jgi:hypothetical protein
MKLLSVSTDKLVFENPNRSSKAERDSSGACPYFDDGLDRCPIGIQKFEG